MARTPEMVAMDDEANQFAMELLMPERFLRDDLAKIDFDIESGQEGEGVKRLAKKYKVSELLMAQRIGQLRVKP